MADLPDNAPRMFQLPGPAQIQQQPGLFQGIAQGVPQGLNAASNLGALNLQAQQIHQQALQQKMQMVDSLIKNGLEYPDALLPMFWPTIAKTMNQINPDYQMDPTKPPENIKSWGGAISQTLDAVNSGVINLSQANQAVVGINKQHLAQPVPSQVGLEGQQQEPSLPGEDAYQAAYKTALNLPRSQIQPAIEALQKSPQAMQMNEAYQTKRALDTASYTQGQENTRNFYNQNQETLRASANTFMSQSENFKNVADNFSAFNHLMQLSSQMEGQGADTTATVNAEKTALLNFAQMAYPGTGRPGNPEMLESMEKSGPYGTLIQQSLNKLDKGDIMTGKQIKGLRQAALALYQGHESQQTQLENAYSYNIKTLGGDPNAFIKNIRIPGVKSTSELFPNQSADHDPAIGHITQTPKGNYQYLGGDPANKDNWSFMGESNE